MDRLLASPHYGERHARHWLDLARFAETYGHEHDYAIPNAWPYRDYVIRAFNADLPYDRFLIEQIAGDLVEPPRRHPTEGFDESIIGTAFFYLGEAHHSPVDVREDEAAHIDNQIDVFAKTFLALTVGCARCHDHKFDAITQKDYYALAGYLQSSRYQQAFLDDPARLQPLLDELAELRSRERAVVAEFVRSCRERALVRIMADLGKAAPSSDAAPKLLADAARSLGHVLHPLAALNVPPASTADANFVARRTELSAALHKRLTEDRSRRSSPLADFRQATFGDWVATGPAFGTRPARPDDLAPRGAAKGPLELQLVAAPAAHSGLIADKLPGVLRSPTFTIEKPHLYYHLWGTGGKVRLILDGLQLIQNPIYGGLEFTSGGAAPHWHEQNVEKWVGHRAYIELVDDGDGWLVLDQVVQADQTPTAEPANALVAAVLNNAALQSPADLAAAYRRLFDTAIDEWLARAKAAQPWTNPRPTAQRSSTCYCRSRRPTTIKRSFRRPWSESARGSPISIERGNGSPTGSRHSVVRWRWPRGRPRTSAFSFAAITRRRAIAYRGAACKCWGASSIPRHRIRAVAWNLRVRWWMARIRLCRG